MQVPTRAGILSKEKIKKKKKEKHKQVTRSKKNANTHVYTVSTAPKSTMLFLVFIKPPAPA